MTRERDAGPLGQLVWAVRWAEWRREDAETVYATHAAARTPEMGRYYRLMWDARRAADEAWTALMDAADAADGVREALRTRGYLP